MNLPVVSRSKGRTLGYDLCFGVEYDMYLVVVLFQFEIVDRPSGRSITVISSTLY